MALRGTDGRILVDIVGGPGESPAMSRLLAGSLSTFCLLLSAIASPALVINVPVDYASVQDALDVAAAGDTVRVCEVGGPYFEKIAFPASGNAVDGFITVEACPGERPVLDGTGVSGGDMVLIANRNYVRIRGFEIRNNLGVNDGSGVRVIGAGSHIEILDNEIHEIRGQDAMGITVYGTEATAISDLVIDGNEIHHCDPFRSEALVLNANVTDFEVTNNVVRDVNNIGIDFIGGETDINPDPSLVARNGVCRGNIVIRANEKGGGYAGGIYVDGGRDIVIERNVVTGSDLGIEIGAENAGTVTSGIVVRDNFVYANDKVGIVFGGFSAGVGRVRDSFFLHNTTYGNDTLQEGFGELWIQYAEDNVIRNNIFHGTGQVPITYSENGNVGNIFDYNLWYSPAGAATEFVWRNTGYAGFAAFQAGSSQDANGFFADPQFVAPAAGDLHLAQTSPAINAGDPGFVPAAGELDIDGGPRVNGAAVEIGADEVALCGDGTLDFGEECDDSNLVDGDGCDSNCTVTGCGNGIVTAGEDCDDGGTVAGDCCSAACGFEAGGASCDDGELCSNADTCDGAGTCVGAATPAPACKGTTGAGKAKLILKNKSNDRGDLAQFRLSRGEATSLADLGTPTAGTDYELCIYDAGAQVLAIPALAGAKWKAIGSGYRFKDKTGSPGGAQVAKVKAGDEGKAKLELKGKGANLEMPVLGLSLPVTAQLRNADGGCWGAVFTAPVVNSADTFKAKSD
jgi:cysteine-rich repeat protein